MRKYTKVTKATPKDSFTGMSGKWVLELECGHSAEAVRWKRSWRNRQKPAPVRVVCVECELLAKSEIA